ncbi:hypothetical protein KM043_009270 [Ampulex compressa]|nr:hypothetical protein KM043_009270 [Ampulex compressa]
MRLLHEDSSGPKANPFARGRVGKLNGAALRRNGTEAQVATGCYVEFGWLIEEYLLPGNSSGQEELIGGKTLVPVPRRETRVCGFDGRQTVAPFTRAASEALPRRGNFVLVSRAPGGWVGEESVESVSTYLADHDVVARSSPRKEEASNLDAPPNLGDRLGPGTFSSLISNTMSFDGEEVARILLEFALLTVKDLYRLDSIKESRFLLWLTRFLDTRVLSETRSSSYLVVNHRGFLASIAVLKGFEVSLSRGCTLVE